MRRGTYSFLMRLLSPFLLRHFERSTQKRPCSVDWEVRAESRFGRYDHAPQISQNAPFKGWKNPVWVHCASLGETRAAIALMGQLLAADLPVLLTHNTATGRELAQKLWAGALQTGQLQLAWIPYDLPMAVQGFYDHWKPRCGLLMERETWPNLVCMAKARGIPMVLVSARMSEKSLKTNRRLGAVMRETFRSLSSILAQTEQDAARCRSLAAQVPIQVVGNLKFDVPLDAEQVAQGRAAASALNSGLCSRPVIAIASLREGEEDLFIPAIQSLLGPFDGAMHDGISDLIIPYFLVIPRHQDTTAACIAQLKNRGMSYLQRSQYDSFDDFVKKLKSEQICQVVIGDSFGEMAFYYALSSAAIVGGSFLPLGGQNIIEPCMLGLKTWVGPHTENFVQAVSDAISAGLVVRANTAQDALSQALYHLQNPQQQTTLQHTTVAWRTQNQGASGRIWSALSPYLSLSPDPKARS